MYTNKKYLNCLITDNVNDEINAHILKSFHFY